MTPEQGENLDANADTIVRGAADSSAPACSVNYSICYNNLCNAPHHNCHVAAICKEFVTRSHVKPNARVSGAKRTEHGIVGLKIN
jgi:hypothetical protein